MSLLQPGAEPFFFPGDKTGCLLSHGFTASPQEVRGLGAHLAHAGFTVLGVRLAGHGTSLEDMSRTRWQDWYASLEDGYHFLKETCSRIIPMGFSTGGVLSLMLATEFPVSGVVTLSTPYMLPPIPGLRILYPMLVPLSWIIPRIPKGKGKWFDPQAQSERVAYDGYPLRAVAEFGKAAEYMREMLPRLDVPVLLVHSKDDNFVPPDHALRLHDELGAKEKSIVWVGNSNHIITCDAARERVYSSVCDFAKRITKTSP
jgi:carboxylesterase